MFTVSLACKRDVIPVPMPNEQVPCLNGVRSINCLEMQCKGTLSVKGKDFCGPEERRLCEQVFNCCGEGRLDRLLVLRCRRPSAKTGGSALGAQGGTRLTAIMWLLPS